MRETRLIWIAAILASAISPLHALELEGVVEWAGRTSLSIPLAGRVERIEVDAGTTFRSGKSLVALDQRPFREHLARCEAEVRRLEASLTEATRERERAEELYDRTVLSDHELSKARIAYTEIESQHAAAAAARNLARLDLEYSQLKAPFDGWVLNRMVEVGENLVPEQELRPLLIVARADRMAVRANVAIDRALQITPGSSGEVEIEGVRYPATIRSVALESGGDNTLLPVVAEFNPPELIRPGTPATIELP